MSLSSKKERTKMKKITLEEKVVNTIKKYEQINSGDKIVVAVSGGPDSICLLNVLNNLKQKLKFEIFVAHINHGLRKNALLDEKYVVNYCKKNNIKCFVKNTDVKKYAKEHKKGTEEAGREIRYAFFDECCETIGIQTKIAVAHNNNDNAETVIMNLLRGSGTEGLKGIEPVRNNVIRPLIEITREEIEEYCKENKLKPRHDESNDENIYTRNKIRNELIPYIQKEFNPNIVLTINRLSTLVRDESKFFNNIVHETYKKIVMQEKKNMIVLNLKKFNDLEIVIKRRIILYIINILKGTTKGIENIHVEDIIKLCNNNRGNKFLTPNKGLKISIKNQKIVIEFKQIL